MQIADILARKAATGVVTVPATSSVRDLLSLLAEHNIGACVVSSDGASVEGIVSERDVVRRLHDAPDILTAPVGSIMTSDVVTCAPEHTLDEVMAMMSNRRIRHLPVCADGTLVGIVSIGDLVKHRIDQLTFEREQLEHYVHQV